MATNDKYVYRCLGCGKWVYMRELCEDCYPKDQAA
jgi:rRNA maturation endonuclease Nob1